jgi:hypothetical protein
MVLTMKTMKLFGTNRHLDLTNVPFSRAGAFLSVYESAEDGCLYLTHCRSESTALKRPNLMRISLLGGDGRELPFAYEADEARLTVTAPGCEAVFAYDGPQMLRARVKGATLRFSYEPEMHEGADVRAADEVEVGINFVGKLLFKGIAGAFSTTAAWNFREVRPFPFVIDIAPGGGGAGAEAHGGAGAQGEAVGSAGAIAGSEAGGVAGTKTRGGTGARAGGMVAGSAMAGAEAGKLAIGELAIHEYYSSGLPLARYRPLEEAEAETRADFEAFLSAYPPVTEIYAEAARRCAWMVWMSQMGPRGSLKDTAIFMHKLLLVRAAGWQQCYAAIAMAGDARRAWRLLLSFFHYQDERGGIPDNIADMNQDNWVSTKPPLFGYAVCHILDRFDTSALAADDYRALYDRLAKYRGWWFGHHDHAGTGFPSYYHVDESGYDESSIFNAGLPLQSPDLIAYMALLDEALARLAGRLGDAEAAGRWDAESKRSLAYLVDELWDGEQFRSKATRTGELHKCGSAAQLQPVLLGARLPKAIVEKLRDRLLDESEFLTDYGVASENMGDPEFTMLSFTRGPVIAPVNMQIVSGLMDAGETGAARKIAIRYLNALLAYGPVLGTSPYRSDAAFGRLRERYHKNQIGAPLTSWGASVFLALAGRLFPAK